MKDVQSWEPLGLIIHIFCTIKRTLFMRLSVAPEEMHFIL